MDQPTEEERLNLQPVDAEGRRRRADQDRESITFKDAATTVAEFTPIIGDAMAAKEIYDELQKEDPDYRFIAVLGGAALVGAVPGIGKVASKGIRNAADMIKRIEADPDALGSLGGNIRLKPKDQVDFDAEMAALDKAEDATTWQQNAKKAVKKRGIDLDDKKSPEALELQESTRLLLENKITREQHLKTVDRVKPVGEYDQLPREPSDKALVFALDSGKREKGVFVLNDETASKLGANTSSLKVGDQFNSRLDIPAYLAHDTWIVAGTSPAVKTADGKGVTTYAKAVHFGGDDKPVRFIASQKQSEKIGTGVDNKTGYATVSGTVKDLDADAIRAKSAELLNDPEWTQVGFDPRRQGGFYVRAGENKHVPVREATEVIQIGPLVLAKNAKLDLEYQGYSEGGMALEEQMAMNFGDVPDNTIGVDPVSGNEIPLGATAENVRDDIPANLSEGEIVVPTDVVNYHGVKLFEDLRAEAKMGYAQMAQDGRIGGEPMDDAAEDRMMDIELSELDLEVMDDEAPVEMRRGGMSMKDYETPAAKKSFAQAAKRNPSRTGRKTHAEIMAQAFGSNTDSRKDNSPAAISSRVQARKNKPKNRFEAIRERLRDVFRDDDRRPTLTQKPRTSDDIGPSIADQINFGGKGFDFRNNQSPTPPPPKVRQSTKGAGSVPYMDDDEPLSVRYYDQPFYKRLMEGLGFDEGGLATDEDTHLIGGEDQFNQPFYAPDQKGGFDMENAYADYGSGGGPLLEMREYVNDAGHRIFITFIDGVPQMEIPPGYYPVEGEGVAVAPEVPPIGGSGGSDSGGSGGSGSGMDMPAPTPINYKELTMEELSQMIEDQKSMKGNALAAGIGVLNPIVGGAIKLAMWNETRQLKAELQRRRDDPATSEVDKRRYDQLLEIANAEEPGLIATLLGKLTGNDPNAPAVRTQEQTDALYNQLDKMTKAYTPSDQEASDRTSRGFTPGVDDAISVAQPAATAQTMKTPGVDTDRRFTPDNIAEPAAKASTVVPKTATEQLQDLADELTTPQVRGDTRLEQDAQRRRDRQEANKNIRGSTARKTGLAKSATRGLGSTDKKGGAELDSRFGITGLHKGALVDKPKVKKVVKGLKKASKSHAKQADQLEKAMKKKSK